MKKILAYGACGCLAAGAIVLIILYLRLGTIIRTAVETWGPKATKTEVRLRLVTLSPFSGNGKIRGLMIGNPAGFKTPFAFRVNAVKIGVDLKSLRGRRILVEEIIVDSPEVTFEGSLNGNNLSQIQRNVEAFAPQSPKRTKSDAQTKVEIGLFKVTRGKVHLAWSGFRSRDITVPLPDIELHGIGRESGGVTTGEAAGKMLGAIIKSALSAAAGAGNLIKGGTAGIGALGKGAAGLLQGLLRKKQ